MTLGLIMPNFRRKPGVRLGKDPYREDTPLPGAQVEYSRIGQKMGAESGQDQGGWRPLRHSILPLSHALRGSGNRPHSSGPFRLRLDGGEGLSDGPPQAPLGLVRPAGHRRGQGTGWLAGTCKPPK